MTTTPVPANIDIEDKILWQLTARQAGLLAPVALGLLGAWHALDAYLPVPVLLPGLVVIGAAAVALVTMRRDGTSLDRLLWAAVRHPRTKLAAGQPEPEAALAAPPAAGATPRPRAETVTAWTGPVRAVTADGLDLGARGHAVAVAVNGVNFALRSASEQAALVAGWARVLHSTTHHVQVVTSIRPASIDGHIEQLRDRARHTSSSALRNGARSYVAWLEEMASGATILRRETTIIATAPTAEDAAQAAGAIAEGVTALGAPAQVLTGHELAARVRAHVDPYTPTPEAAASHMAIGDADIDFADDETDTHAHAHHDTDGSHAHEEVLP